VATPVPSHPSGVGSGPVVSGWAASTFVFPRLMGGGARLGEVSFGPQSAERLPPLSVLVPAHPPATRGRVHPRRRLAAGQLVVVGRVFAHDPAATSPCRAFPLSQAHVPLSVTPSRGAIGPNVPSGGIWLRRRCTKVAVRLEVHVRPGSSATTVGGEHDGTLVVRVVERAASGRATEAALRAVAEAFGVPGRSVTLVRGTTSRRKLIEIDVGHEDGVSLERTLLRLRRDGGA